MMLIMIRTCRLTFEELIDIVSKGKVNINRLLGAEFPLSQTKKAFEAFTHNDGDLEKVLVQMRE